MFKINMEIYVCVPMLSHRNKSLFFFSKLLVHFFMNYLCSLHCNICISHAFDGGPKHMKNMKNTCYNFLHEICHALSIVKSLVHWKTQS